MDVQINFWNGKDALHIEADSLAQGAKKLVASNADLRYADLSNADLSGADLSGADLSNADLSNADLSGAKYGEKLLWSSRPILQLGPCGSASRATLVFFFDDKSEPIIQCGCFSGNIAEFEAKINKTHGDCFYGQEYSAMLLYIKEMRKIQIEGK